MPSTNSSGARLRQFRKKHHLTQEQLAEQLGYSAESIRKMEGDRRRVTRPLAEQLADMEGIQGDQRAEFIEHLLTPDGDLPISYDLPNTPSPAGNSTPETPEPQDPAPGDPPYKGLTFFDETDAHLYFGRTDLIHELVCLLAQANQDNSRFLAVIGASGSGKSSLVRAGLVPALKAGVIDGSDRWLIKILTPTTHPLKELAVALTEQESNGATLQLMDDLSADERVLDLHVSKLFTNDDRTNRRLLLIVDQFEELFTLCKDPVERSIYIDNLLTAAQAGGPTIVVLTLRADFYRHCLEYEQLRLLLERHTKTIGAMDDEALRTAIVTPAQANGWKFEVGLVDLFLDDVGTEPGALPLLSHALRETWERRRGYTLTLAGYSTIGRVPGAIATTADRILAGLNDTQKLVAQRIFLRLTELGEGAEDTRRRVSLAELLPSEGERQNVEEVLQILVDARLITTHGNETDGEAEVAHEALIREWPRLRTWLSDNRQGLHIHRRLTESANDWKKLGFDEGVLYRGTRLEQLLAWVQEHPSEVNEREWQFLEASRSAVAAAKKAEEEARNRELEHQRLLAIEGEKRAKLAEQRAQDAATHAKEQEIAAIKLKTGRNFLVVASIIALIFAALAGMFGAQSNQNANQANLQRVTAVAAQATTTAALAIAEVDRAHAITQQGLAEAQATVAFVAQATAVASARLANAERIAVQARFLSASTNPNDLDVALILASQAVNLTLTNEGYVLANADLALSESIAAAQQNQWHTVFVLPHPTSVLSVAYSPDGQKIVSASADPIIRLWEVKSGKEIAQLTGHTASARSAAFSPDGQQIVSASEDKTVRLWDVASGTEIRQLTGHTATVMSAAFSPDGTQIVSASEDQTVRIWDVASGTEIRQLLGHTGIVNSAVFSPDGLQIVSVSFDQTTRIWGTASGKEIHQMTSPADTEWLASVGPDAQKNVWSAVFSLDGQTIATANEDTTVSVWNVESGKELHPLFTLTVGVRSASFSPDGKDVVGAIVDNRVLIWNVASEKITYQLLGHTAAVRSVDFRPDGKQIASASEDGTVRLWDAPSRQEAHRLLGHTGSVRSAAFSPDGKQLISASEDTTIRIWDVQSRQELRQLQGHEDSVRSAVFSPDGKLIVSASEDGTVRLWDAASGKEVRQLHGHEGAVWSARFSPDGQQLVTASQDNTVRIWDVANGKEVRQLTGHENSVWSAVFSLDGQLIGSGSDDGTIRIWKVVSGKELHRLTGHTYSVWSVTFSPDLKQIASTGEEGTVRIWDVERGTLVRQLLGHTAGVRSVAFSPDGKQIASASADKTVRIWDVASGKEIRQLLGHTERILWVAYSPDGQQIVSTSADTTLRLWQPSIAKSLAQAQGLIQRDPPMLTPEEQQQYGVQ